VWGECEMKSWNIPQRPALLIATMFAGLAACGGPGPGGPDGTGSRDMPSAKADGQSGAGGFGDKANDPGAGQASGGASGKGDSASSPTGSAGPAENPPHK
jgi:hypothetical protein